MAITVNEQISESATTTVFRAYDETLGRDVLLKVLHRHLAHDDNVRERFVREARACAALHSEHIVQVYDLREHEGSPAILMEFVQGRSLKDVIADGALRTYAFAEKVAVHVLQGLAVAHAQGIIHRDIKPGNILVSAGGAIKLTDFGLAQIGQAPTLTSEGMIVGTPAYIAPEIVLGEQADARSDLFSLGATIVETLTGERLFEGATYSDCLNRISQFRTDRLDALSSVSSPDFVAFLKRLMHPDRDRRYSSPKEALAALKKSASSQFARPSNGPKRTQTAPAGRPVLALISLLIIIGLFVLIQFYGPGMSSLVGSRSGPGPLGPAAAQGMQPVDTLAGDSSSSPPPGPSNAAGAVHTNRERGQSVPEQGTGSLTIAGSIGATIKIDEQVVGELPLPGPLQLAAGRHTVVVTLPPFEPIVRTVEVEPGGQDRLTADFLADAAYLRCIATPWAEIYVDNVYRDTTPFDRPIAVSAGARVVKFHHPSLGDSVLRVTIARRETLSLRMTFKP